MKSRIRLSFIALIFLAFLPLSFVLAQDDDCRKTKVAVSVEIVDTTYNYDWLEKDFGPHSKSEWYDFVTTMLVQILREYEPELTFFPLSESSGDHHYLFKAPMTLTVVGEDEDNEQTGYWVTGSLIANANCIPNRNWVVAADAHHGEAVELKQAMKNLVSYFWPMDRNIISYEEEHPSAPRKPDLNIQFEKDYISPIDKESRKTQVYAKVYDCRGHLVCDKRDHNSGQPVYYQDKIDRLDLKLGRCMGGYHIENFMVIVTNKDCVNEGEYKLEKGIDAEEKDIGFKTCQLGGPIVEVEEKLIIRGLKIEVKPDRRQIEKEQRTNIVLTFNETDPDGTKHPIEGKELEVKITGLENGTIKPKNGYTTNSEGKVILDYKAGSNDEKITVTASFQPEDYPDKAEGKGSVTVDSSEFEARITITKNLNRVLQTENEDAKRENINRRQINETINASATIYLTLTNTMDMPIMNQTWHYYKPVSVSVNTFTNNYKEKRYMAGRDFETNIDVTRINKTFKIEAIEYISQFPPWMLVIDNETEKAVKLLPAGYGIEYEFIETENSNTTSKSKKESSTETKQRKKTFELGPVGEEITDPTVKQSSTWIQDYLKRQGIELPPGAPIPNIPNSDVIKEIQPDILVKYGDGKANCGGGANRLIENKMEDGFEKINLTYNWQMTINKKK